MNAKKYLFEKIRERLANDCLGEDGKPFVKTFELFQNQFENERNEDAINYPVVYLQFASLQYKGELQNIQTTEAIVTVHIGMTDLDAYEIDFLDIIDKIHFSLHGFEDVSKYFTALYRVAERQVISRDNVQVWEVDYSTFLQDLSTHTKQRLSLVPVTLDLSLEDAPDADTKPWLVNT